LVAVEPVVMFRQVKEEAVVELMLSQLQLLQLHGCQVQLQFLTE
jgi:hypothetical protein